MSVQFVVAGVLQMLSFKKQKNMIQECGRYNKKKSRPFLCALGVEMTVMSTSTPEMGAEEASETALRARV